MITFVINIRELAQDIPSLVKQLEAHEKSLDAEGKKITNFDLKVIKEQINKFPSEFVQKLIEWEKIVLKERQNYEDAIKSGITLSPKKDIYDNSFGLPYDYAEISYENIGFIKRIRLLAVGPAAPGPDTASESAPFSILQSGEAAGTPIGINDTGAGPLVTGSIFASGNTNGTLLTERRRFILEVPGNPSVMENPWSATTLNLIRNIKDIIKSGQDVAYEEFLKCKRKAWDTDSKFLASQWYNTFPYSDDVEQKIKQEQSKLPPNIVNKPFAPGINYTLRFDTAPAEISIYLDQKDIEENLEELDLQKNGLQITKEIIGANSNPIYNRDITTQLSNGSKIVEIKLTISDQDKQKYLFGELQEKEDYYKSLEERTRQNLKLADYKYTWDELTSRFFSPLPIYAKKELSDEEIQAKINEYNQKSISDIEELRQRERFIQQQKLEIIKAKEKKVYKAETDLDILQQIYSDFKKYANQVNGNAILQSIPDRISFGCILQEVMKCIKPGNINCRVIFENLQPDEIIKRISFVYPRFSDTFRSIEKAIKEAVYGREITRILEEIKREDYDTKISENEQYLEELKFQQLSGQDVQEEINRLEGTTEEYRQALSSLEQELERAYISQEEIEFTNELKAEMRKGGNLEVLLKQTKEGQREGTLSISQKIIAGVDTIIPIEDLCEIFVSLLSGNGFPNISFPFEDQPLNDIFNGFSLKINESFLRLLTQAFVTLLEGLIKDLVNCNNLDKFIADMIGSNSDNPVGQALQNIYSEENLSNIIKGRSDQFLNTIASQTNSLFSVGNTSGSINFGIRPQDFRDLTIGIENKTGEQYVETLANTGINSAVDFAKQLQQSSISQAAANQAKKNESKWDIDDTKTKFIIKSGVRIINLQAFDQYLTNKLNEIDTNGFSLRSIAEAGGEDAGIGLDEDPTIVRPVQNNTGQPVLDPQQTEQLAEDLSCVMRNIISLISPTQVLALFARGATTETKEILAEIMKVCSPGLSDLLPNPEDAANFIGNIGEITGLDTLQDDLQDMIETPEFGDLFPVNRCGRYRSVEEFREALMMRVVEPDEARQVMEQIEAERIGRFNEFSGQLLEASLGNVVIGNDYDPNELFVESIKHILNKEIKRNNKQIQSNKINISDEIKKEIKSTLNNSPIYQNMFKSALDSMFLPLKQIFNIDLDGLTEAFSDIVEVEKPISRTITIQTQTGEKVTSINPDFKELLKNDLVPVLKSKDGKDPDDKYAKMVEKNSLKSFTILKDIEVVGDLAPDPFKELFTIILDDEENGIWVSGEPSKNYLEKGLNGVPLKPVLKKENQKVVGDSLLKNLNNFIINTTTNSGMLNINLEGYLNLPSQEYARYLDIPSLNTFLDTNQPRWNISFLENVSNSKITNTISLNTEGSLYTPGNGLEDFYVKNYSVSQNIQRADNISGFLENKFNTVDVSRKASFDQLLFEKIKPFIYDRSNSNLENDFSQSSNSLYSLLIDSFIRESIKGIIDSDLLKKVSDSEQSFTKLEALQLTKECEHILDLDGIRSEFQELYELVNQKLEKIPKTQAEISGLTNRKSPLSTTSLIVLSKMLIRLMCVDVLVKSILAFEHYKYSKNIIENEFFTNLMCSFIDTELNRINGENKNLARSVYEIINLYYEIKVKSGEYEEITIQEKNEFRKLNLPYTIELKKIVQSEFKEILQKMKKIANVRDEPGLENTNDFIKYFIDQYPVLKVHDNIGVGPNASQQKESIYEDYLLEQNGGFIIQKYILFPQLNKDSNIVKNNKNFFTEQKIKEINNYGVMDIGDAVQKFTTMMYTLGKTFTLCDCREIPDQDSLFLGSFKFGLRLLYVNKKNVAGPQLKIKNNSYPYYQDVCHYYKSGYIKETKKEYDAFIIADERISANTVDEITVFTGRNNQNYYDSEFYLKLKKKLCENIDTNILLSYSLPLKELSSIIIMHSNLSNNNVKMKYLLETSKKMSSQMFSVLSNIGNKTLSSNRLQKMLQTQLDARSNVGNPAGPLDFDALKPFLRTPIQIMKGMTTINDPNLAIVDKLAALMSAAGATTGQKIFIPYNLTSLALLPFPIFTPPPAGIIPPLTAYNITLPLVAPFFVLEPLLWDLPWFKNNNAGSLPDTIDCDDEDT